jgi:hypothetical protein
MLEVLTPAVSLLLTKLADVKADLGIPTTDTSNDAVLTDLIEEASDEIQREFQFFCKQTYRETLPGYGTPILQLKRTPIVTVSLVKHLNDPIIDYTIEDKEAGHLYRKQGWLWTASVGWNMTGYVMPNTEHPEFTVEYEAGYLAADQPSSDMPGAIQRSARETVKDWYLARKRAEDVASKSVGDLSISYKTASEEKRAIPARAYSRLEKFRRVAW